MLTILANAAMRVGAFEEALHWSDRALALAATVSERCPRGLRTQLHLHVSSVWYHRGDVRRALAADEAALTAARADQQPSAELAALWHLAHDATQGYS